VVPNLRVNVMFWIFDRVLLTELEKSLSAELEQFLFEIRFSDLSRIVYSEIVRAVDHQLRVYPGVSVKGGSNLKNLSEDTDTQASACPLDTFTNVNKVNELRLSALF